MSLHNIAEYKKALVVVKDIEKILKILSATEASLRSYAHYRAIQHVLAAISDEKPILDWQLEVHKIIVETKGSRRL